MVKKIVKAIILSIMLVALGFSFMNFTAVNANGFHIDLTYIISLDVCMFPKHDCVIAIWL